MYKAKRVLDIMCISLFLAYAIYNIFVIIFGGSPFVNISEMAKKMCGNDGYGFFEVLVLFPVWAVLFLYNVVVFLLCYLGIVTCATTVTFGIFETVKGSFRKTYNVLSWILVIAIFIKFIITVATISFDPITAFDIVSIVVEPIMIVTIICRYIFVRSNKDIFYN